MGMLRPRRVVRIAGWRGNRRRSTLVKLQRQVRALKPELKCFQLPYTFNNQASGATIAYVSNIGQGSDVFNRLGDKISMKKVYNQAFLSGLAIGSQSIWRLFLIRDLESNGIIPTVSGAAQSIFTGADPGSAVVQNNVKERFKIIMIFDWSETTVVNGGTVTNLRTRWKVLNTETKYHDGTANQTGAGKHAYYLVVMTNTGVAVGDILGQLEFYYTDA